MNNHAHTEFHNSFNDVQTHSYDSCNTSHPGRFAPTNVVFCLTRSIFIFHHLLSYYCLLSIAPATVTTLMITSLSTIGPIYFPQFPIVTTHYITFVVTVFIVCTVCGARIPTKCK